MRIKDSQVKEEVLPEEMVIREGGGDNDPDHSDDGDGDDFSSSTDSSVPKKRKQKGPKYVYMLQGPPGPKGQEGQPGQAGRDGRDGQDLSLTKVLEETLKAQKPNLDTTSLRTLLTNLVEPSLKC